MKHVFRVGALVALVLALLTVPAFAQDADAVEVSDQEVTDGTVTIDSVTTTEAGWLVIHEGSCDDFGDVVGHAEVQAGDNADVSVPFDEGVEVTEDGQYCAMLHSDTGETGTYEFPDADPPVQDADGNIVMTTFTAQAAEAMQEATETPAAEETETPMAEETETPMAEETETPTADGTPTPETLPETGGTDAGSNVGILVALVGLFILRGVGAFVARRGAGRTA